MRLFVEMDNWLDHRYYAAAQLGPTPSEYAGNFIARPFWAADGAYPIRTTTFFAPGGIRLQF